MSRQLYLDVHHELIVDLFAGGGGMSTAFEMALGRSPDIAINHNDDALSMHRANHPQTRHFIADVFEVCPRGATQGRPICWLHLSPDCTHHSQAAGGQPRSKKIRGLSWVGYRWAGQVAPRVISLENVPQILKWSPLVARRDKATGRVIKLDKTIAAPGERVPVQEQFLVPDTKREGKTWKRFVRALESLGYKVETDVSIAADLGGHTTRKRLFMIARRDGAPIVMPARTHAKNPTKEQAKWKPAADCIDWNVPCPSIFSRKKPLADATHRRIARGIVQFVLNNPTPFIVPIAHYNGRDTAQPINEPLRTITAATKGGEFALTMPTIVPATHQGDDRVHDPRDPLRTITGASRGELMLSSPLLAKFRADSPGADIVSPMPTITAGGDCARPAGAPHALGLVAPTLVLAAHGDGQPGRAQRWGNGATDIAAPLGTPTASGGHAIGSLNTITTDGHHAVVSAFMANYYTDDANRCREVSDPAATITTENRTEDEVGALRVAAFLMRYHGQGGQWTGCDRPFTTMTTKDRLALVTVIYQGTPYIITDIGLRMLQPRELYRGNDFPDTYKIDYGHDGRRFSKSAQVRMVGNSVDPIQAAAYVEANANEMATLRRVV